jgi:hypothetical protein
MFTDPHNALGRGIVAAMDERSTLRIPGWTVSSVVLSFFVLSAISVPH